MRRNSPEHIRAVFLIDNRFNDMLVKAKERFQQMGRGDPDFDPAFQAVRRKIEADRKEEYRYLHMELEEG